MPTSITKGQALVGAIAIAVAGGLTYAGVAVTSTGTELNLVHGLDSSGTAGVVPQYLTATVARTDTTAKNLFTLPAGAIPVTLEIEGPAVSNAATTATLGIGTTATGSYFVSGFDVKGATGLGLYVPGAAQGVGVAISGTGSGVQQITGIYAETGTASTLGGPWTVIMGYRAK